MLTHSCLLLVHLWCVVPACALCLYKQRVCHTGAKFAPHQQIMSSAKCCRLYGAIQQPGTCDLHLLHAKADCSVCRAPHGVAGDIIVNAVGRCLSWVAVSYSHNWMACKVASLQLFPVANWLNGHLQALKQSVCDVVSPLSLYSSTSYCLAGTTTTSNFLLCSSDRR